MSNAVTLMVNLFNPLHHGTKNRIVVVLNITILSGSKIVTKDINITVNKHNFEQFVLKSKTIFNSMKFHCFKEMVK